ncbi:MAG: CBS domain-containing protein [Candidatus Acetothermia bacterium]|nr:CBS domain-containing protein [Candidatus Acetothermia bacterium]MDH7506025.1 CBS domain-containing protein [Candidatus Acetothermia bacterium]
MAQIKRDKNLPAGAVAQRRLIVAYPDETLDLAWERMGRHGIGRLPVVAREDPRRLVGFLTKGDLIRFRKGEEQPPMAADRAQGQD